MLNFVVLEKGLGIVSPQQFVYDFLRVGFFMLYLLISFSDSVYCLRYWPICVCVHDQKDKKKLIILRMKRAFKVKYKAFSIILKGLSAASDKLSQTN